MFGDRGVLRPGQTLVEHDDGGLCRSRQCSRSLDPASGFYLLRTSSTNCSAHCQPVRPPPPPNRNRAGFCLLTVCFFRIRSTSLPEMRPPAAAFARTFPASTPTRTGPPFSIRCDHWRFCTISARAHVHSNLCGVALPARKVLGVQLHEVRLHGDAAGAHAHLLPLQLPALQRDRVHEGTCIRARAGT